MCSVESVRSVRIYICFSRLTEKNVGESMVCCLQKSRSNGGRRNPREARGWLQQARRLRLQVAAEEVPYQGCLRRS